MKLSVVIPLYNAEKYISTCLDSVLNQNISKSVYEIVIVNDGSKDNSLQKVEEYAKKHSNISIYNQKNSGVAKARNIGVEKAKGTFIYFLDADDYIASNTFEIFIDKLNDDIDLVAFIAIQTNKTDLNEIQKNEINNTSNEIIEGVDFIEKYGFKDAVGWFMVRKQFLLDKNLQYLEGKMLEDISFNIKLLTKVKRVLYLPIDVYRYVNRENSIMTKTNAKHFKKIISDYERILIELEEQVEKFEVDNAGAAERLRGKRGIYHFFLFMRLMRSDLSINEIDKSINRYKKMGLYPLRQYSNSHKIKTLISIFNRKYLFYPFLKIYRLFSKRAI